MTGSVVVAKAGSRAERDPRPEPGRLVTGAIAATSAAPPLLRVSGLSVSFGRVRALDGVDLSVRSGELVALAGENGAGKTTLVRCIAGDIVPATGEVFLAGKRVPADPARAAKQGIAVVWQDLALCDNLDIAANIMLGRESARLMLSDIRFHGTTAALLASLRIPLTDTARIVKSLSGGQRQLVAVARAMGRKPRLLALDEPTTSLGVKESAQVEELIMNLRAQGVTILLACHDIDQMFRLADRIVVLRQGRILADLRPADTYPDDVVALLSGQQVDSSARRQLTRLHGLTDRLVSADPSSSLSLILSALGSALGSERLCIHVVSDKTLYCAASLGFPHGQLGPWSRLPFGAAGGPVGMAAADEQPVIADNVRISAAWRGFRDLAKTAKVASSWSVPVLGPSGLSGVITVFRPVHGAPMREELDLVTVYAGYAASAIERDRLLDQVTTRNRVLETIREMLETLAGPVPVSEGLAIAIQSLRRGLQAEEVALITQSVGQPLRWRACAGPFGTDPSSATPSLRGMAGSALASVDPDGVARELRSSRRHRARAVAFVAAGGPTVLLATWQRVPPTKEETALMEDAAHSLRLALEREEAAHAHQEAAALRRSRELQRGFLSRLSHELRTPLTAIRGYASSLMQPDVTWDGASQQRFLDRIAAESARLGRLVDDLLDYSAIESGIMRLQPDWCDIRLVLEAAIGCLPPASAESVSLTYDAELPVVWADHDRMEQVFVNLLNNAVGHNPPGTRVRVTATADRGTAAQVTAGEPGATEEQGTEGGQAPSEVVISVLDDGTGMPPELAAAPFEPARRPGPGTSGTNGTSGTTGTSGTNGTSGSNGTNGTNGRSSRKSAGAGLGLSIAKGIVQAHGGRIELTALRKGTCFSVYLPVEAGSGGPAAAQRAMEVSGVVGMANDD
jgi:signal transduction histidine kinase/ABC-type multidrug transport system ATPase subunit